MNRLKHLSFASIGTALAAIPSTAFAQVYNGGGVTAGISAAAGLGLATGNPFQILLRVIAILLSFMGLVAVCAIIIAGIYMIVSLGNDDGKEKAKKIIKYTLIGLIIILFSRILVGLVTHVLYGVTN